jgi:hypothetical protein
MESNKAFVKEHELELKKKHGTLYSPFQYKLWAEMYFKSAHTSLEEPPAAAMFNRDVRSGKLGQSDLVVSVIDKLCEALTPQQARGGCSSILSPFKKVELRSAYIKQLGDLKNLYENEILNIEEYQEQKGEVVTLMRQLKKQ